MKRGPSSAPSRSRRPGGCPAGPADQGDYLASKHYGVHLPFKAGVSTRAICGEMGGSEKVVDKLVATYGHADIAALEEIDAL